MNPYATTAESQIRTLIEQWQLAVLNQDVDAVIRLYAPEVVAFDAINALQFKGRNAYEKHWRTCMELFKPEGQVVFEIHEVEVSVDSTLAYCRALHRCGGISPDGQENVGWMRYTAVLEKRGEQWLIVHEHISQPFDIQTMKVMNDAPSMA